MGINIAHRLRRRKALVLSLLVTGIIVFSTVFLHDNLTIPDTLNDHLTNIYNKSGELLGFKGAIGQFYDEFFETLIANSPEPVEKKPFSIGENCDIGTTGVDVTSPVYSKERLGRCLQADKDTLHNLKSLHGKMLKQLPKEFPLGFYSGDGIVMVGGGKFSALALLAIKTLRYRGTTLPIEVFMPEGEAEDAICGYLKSLNARCISLGDILSNVTMDKLDIKGYQLKSLLIMASSFENILLLDADNNLIENVDQIFSTAPFNETGLVTWPDYWKRTTSPIFYDIAGVELGERVRLSIDDKTPISAYVSGDENLDTDVPLHDRANAIPDGSTESGQLLMNKYKHADTILLSFYYNFNGPHYYYPLLGQGTAGEGDKDTFLAAAEVLHKPFYQVKKPPGTEGYHRPDGFHGACMLQADPIKDYELYSKIPKDVTEDMGFPKVNKAVTEGAYFIHAHFPKLEPYDLYESKVMLDGTQHTRLYSNLQKHGVKFDFELLQFVNMNELFCEKDLDFQYANSKQLTKEEVCNFIKEHHDFLVKDSEQDFGGI